MLFSITCTFEQFGRLLDLGCKHFLLSLRVLHLALIHEQWGVVQCLLEEIVVDNTWIPYLDIQNDLGQVNVQQCCQIPLEKHTTCSNKPEPVDQEELLYFQ